MRKSRCGDEKGFGRRERDKRSGSKDGPNALKEQRRDKRRRKEKE